MRPLESVRANSKKFEEALDDALSKTPASRSLDPSEPSMDQLREGMLDGSTDGPAQGDTEAIILGKLRPAWFINNDLIEIDGDYDHEDLVTNNKQMLEEVSRSIGCVDLINHATMDYVGTGWLIEDDIAVTNRHVAKAFTTQNWIGQNVFAGGAFGRDLESRIDYVRQHVADNIARRRVDILEVLFIAPDNGPDIAFLKVETNGNVVPLELQNELTEPLTPVAAVGYPAWDGGRNDPDLMNTLFKNIYDVKRFSPGLVTTRFSGDTLILTDYTSLGGNSGSAVLDLESGKVVGLHFAGSFRETNYAVAANIVSAALASLKTSIGGIAVPADVSTESFPGRDGYVPDFLGDGNLRVDIPDFCAASNDLAPVSGSTDSELTYTHFSVYQSKSRRLPMLTAVNIDGEKAFGLKRKGSWRLDGRLDRAHQIGNELYFKNPLDRGHMVRRKDPGWGDSREEAQEAEIDTFHYTNSAPQHKDLNQRDWVGLEDYILEATETRDFKASIMTGPVFRDDDPTLKVQAGAEDVKIPRSFWKIAAMINDDTGELSVTGYILTQGDMIKDLTEAAFVFGEFKTYQVKIAVIEAATGYDFGNLKDHDPLQGEPEGIFRRGVRPLDGPESLKLSP